MHVAVVSSVSFESIIAIARFYDGPARPDSAYTACCTVITAGPVVFAKGMAGTVSKQNIVDFYLWGIDRGATALYVERIDDHTVPLGRRMKGGDFDGLWRVAFDRFGIERLVGRGSVVVG